MLSFKKILANIDPERLNFRAPRKSPLRASPYLQFPSNTVHFSTHWATVLAGATHPLRSALSNLHWQLRKLNNLRFPDFFDRSQSSHCGLSLNCQIPFFDFHFSMTPYFLLIYFLNIILILPFHLIIFSSSSTPFALPPFTLFFLLILLFLLLFHTTLLIPFLLFNIFCFLSKFISYLHLPDFYTFKFTFTSFIPLFHIILPFLLLLGSNLTHLL